MTDETSCTGLSKIDGPYAKAVGHCCDMHDDMYSNRTYRWWLRADFEWAKCAWRAGDGAGHKAKTVCFAAALMALGWFKYYDLDKWLIARLPFLEKFDKWLG